MTCVSRFFVAGRVIWFAFMNLLRPSSVLGLFLASRSVNSLIRHSVLSFSNPTNLLRLLSMVPQLQGLLSIGSADLVSPPAQFDLTCFRRRRFG